MADLRSLAIYGASDDLLEIEGLIEEEFECYTATTLYVKTPDGAQLAVTAEFCGTGPMSHIGSGWVLTVHHSDPHWTYPIRLERRNDYDEDPAVVLEVPVGTTVTERG